MYFHDVKNKNLKGKVKCYLAISIAKTEYVVTTVLCLVIINPLI